MKSMVVKLILVCYAIPLFAGKFEQGILREQINDSITLFYTDKYVKKNECPKVETVQASLVLYEKTTALPSMGMLPITTSKLEPSNGSYKMTTTTTYTNEFGQTRSHPNGSVNNIPTGTFKTEVKIDKRFVDPYETDSIVVNGKVGKPHSKSQWAFPYDSGLISVSTMLPNSPKYNPLYVSNNSKTHLFPPYLSLKDTNIIIVEISKKLAKSPRLYCDYNILGWNGLGGQGSSKNSNRVEIIATLNKMPPELLLDSSTAVKAAQLSNELLVPVYSRKNDSLKAIELLAIEPTSVIGNCKMAEFAINAGDMAKAMEYYKKASENQIGEDFLVAELSGKRYEAEGNKEEAINAYKHTIEIIGDRESQFYKSKIKDLENRIGLMIRKK